MLAPTNIAPVSAEVYLDGVRALLPTIRERSLRAEQLGRMPEETVRDLEEAGVFGALQPRRWGGLEIDPATFYRSVVLLGSACASTGWVVGVLAAHPWEVALMQPQAQEDVWGTNNLARISSSYAPTGKAERVVGGYRLSGRWGFSSGVDLCDWALLGAVVDSSSDRSGDPEFRVFLVDRPNFTVDHESWDVTGLSGTGSKDVEVSGGFVPEHRSHGIADVHHEHNPGWEINDGPLYRLPWVSGIFAYAIASPAIGAATGAIQTYAEQLRRRVSAFGGATMVTNSAAQARLAEALTTVETATSVMTTIWSEMYGLACAGEPIGIDLRTRSRYAAARSIRDAVNSVLTVFEMAGGSVMKTSNPLQRYLRDLLAMRNHPMAALEAAAAVRARDELGLEPIRFDATKMATLV